VQGLRRINPNRVLWALSMDIGYMETRPDSEVIAELEYLREGYKRQRQAAISDSSSPERVGRAIERCREGIARLEKEIAELTHRRDNAPDICEQCDTRIAELTNQIEGIKRRSEVDKLRQQLADAGLI